MQRSLRERLRFDRDAVRNSWRHQPLAVPGVYNSLGDGGGRAHGVGCPLCAYVSDAPSAQAEGGSSWRAAQNHINAINAIVRACGDYGANVDAVADIVCQYWRKNVKGPRDAEGIPCPELTLDVARDHFVGIVDSTFTGGRSVRVLNALEDLLLQDVRKFNEATEEVQSDHDAIKLLLLLQRTRVLVHKTNWKQTNFQVPSSVSEEAMASVLPVVNMFAPTPTASSTTTPASDDDFEYDVGTTPANTDGRRL